MAGQKITITLDANVLLQTLIEKLDKVRHALTYAEEHAAIGGRRRSISYRVVDMHHSRATVVIEPIAEDPLDDRTNATVYEFSTRLRQIQTSNVPDDVSVEELEAYRELLPKADEELTQLTIGLDAPTILRNVDEYTLTPDLDKRLADMIGPEEVAWGTITGYLKAINLHERNVFYIWPRVGPKRVYCTFQRAMRDDVIAAMTHYVEVSGEIHYRRRDDTATSVRKVYNIEILDTDDTGTRLRDLRGIAPNATGEMDTREFVDSYDEDW